MCGFKYDHATSSPARHYMHISPWDKYVHIFLCPLDQSPGVRCTSQRDSFPPTPQPGRPLPIDATFDRSMSAQRWARISDRAFDTSHGRIPTVMISEDGRVGSMKGEQTKRGISYWYRAQVEDGESVAPGKH